MNLKDRLLFVVPAIGAAVPVFLRALPQIFLVIGFLLFLVFGPQAASNVGATEANIRNFMPVMVALLSLLVAFGGLAVKQYTSYRNKQIKFLKDVTDTLFFRSLSSNASVFHALVDAAEEEETKEIILVYYHLLTSPTPLTPAKLDDRIEEWMEEKFSTKIDFDINGPIGNLEKLRLPAGVTPQNGEALLSRDSQGTCQVLPLDQAKALIDQVWDNLFDYANDSDA